MLDATATSAVTQIGTVSPEHNGIITVFKVWVRINQGL